MPILALFLPSGTFDYFLFFFPKWNFTPKLKILVRNTLGEDMLLWRDDLRPLLDVKQLLVLSFPTAGCREALWGELVGIWDT